MDYTKFVESVETLRGGNYDTLKSGYNSCDVCFDFNIYFREMLGEIRLQIECNKAKRFRDKEIMSYFILQQTILAVRAVKTGICSHLKSTIDLDRLEKTEDYIRIKRILDDEEN